VHCPESSSVSSFRCQNDYVGSATNVTICYNDSFLLYVVQYHALAFKVTVYAHHPVAVLALFIDKVSAALISACSRPCARSCGAINPFSGDSGS